MSMDTQILNSCVFLGYQIFDNESVLEATYFVKYIIILKM